MLDCGAARCQVGSVGPVSTNGQSGPVVSAVEVTRRYGGGDTAVDALRGVSLEVNPGELVAVMGPSGSGKSTLMHILAALDNPTTGHVRIAGQDVGSLTDREVTLLRRAHIGFVFQFFNLLPMLTAEENVVLPLSIAGVKPEKAFLEDLLKRLGLADRRTHRPAELSGGQQQRVAIARALVSRPSVVLADEPTGNLDSGTSHEILQLLRSATEDYGQTTVMVTHDAAAAAIAGRILFLNDGVIADQLGRSEPGEILAAISRISA
jgi:putative ABC transport system ATP-binding protein